MIDWRHHLTAGIRPRTIVATYALGGIGWVIGASIGLPLAALMGAMIAVAVVAAAGGRLFGAVPDVPQGWRQVFIPALGVAIGGGVPPDFFQHAIRWWPTALAVVAFVPLAHALSYRIYRRLGRLDPITAYFSAMPGGFIESMEMGDERGARMPMLVMLQFLRLILCITLLPLAFRLVTGHAVGSGAGIALPGAEIPLTVRDGAILLATAVGGYFGAQWLGLPAAALSGPLFLSGLVHALGITGAVPPGWLIVITQFVMGVSLGVRFAGVVPSQLWLALRLAVVAILVSLATALIIALLLAGVVDEPVPAVILAFAPGGASEMALVAISLNLSAVFVTIHHLIRILLAVVVARLGVRLITTTKLT